MTDDEEMFGEHVIESCGVFVGAVLVSVRWGMNPGPDPSETAAGDNRWGGVGVRPEVLTDGWRRSAW